MRGNKELYPCNTFWTLHAWISIQPQPPSTLLPFSDFFLSPLSLSLISPILLCLQTHRATHRRCGQELSRNEPTKHHLRCQASHRLKILRPICSKWHEALALQSHSRSRGQAHDRGHLQRRREFSAEEISSMVLTKMRRIVEAYLGQTIKKRDDYCSDLFQWLTEASYKGCWGVSGISHWHLSQPPWCRLCCFN